MFVRKFFLLADDDNDDAELFAEALTATGTRVDFFRVEDSLELFKFLSGTQNRKPDIIFLDINMPPISGWQCLTKIKNDDDYKNIPVVMYSTSSYSCDKDIAIELGALGFLTKPSNFKILVEILGRIANTEIRNLKKVLHEITTH